MPLVCTYLLLTLTFDSFYRICSKHFRPEDFIRDLRNEMLGLPLRNLLKPGSCPILPNAVQDNHQMKTSSNAEVSPFISKSDIKPISE